MWQVVTKLKAGQTIPRYPRKQAALEAAQTACRKEGDSATVYDSKGRVRFRYWRDSEGLQYIEY
jgi:hypothetical protein